MSDKYISGDGFRPMVLPDSGEELLEGRQYVLTPLARVILLEAYGLGNIPTIVECVHRKIAATIVLTRTINLETGQVSKSRLKLQPQAASFRAFLQKGRVVRFELDIKKLDELAPFYSDSHKIPQMEEDWFATRCLPPLNRKFRGCTLRWWDKGAEVKLGGSFKPYMRRKQAVDLSILDLSK